MGVPKKRPGFPLDPFKEPIGGGSPFLRRLFLGPGLIRHSFFFERPIIYWRTDEDESEKRNPVAARATIHPHKMEENYLF